MPPAGIRECPETHGWRLALLGLHPVRIREGRKPIPLSLRIPADNASSGYPWGPAGRAPFIPCPWHRIAGGDATQPVFLSVPVSFLLPEFLSSFPTYRHVPHLDPGLHALPCAHRPRQRAFHRRHRSDRRGWHPGRPEDLRGAGGLWHGGGDGRGGTEHAGGARGLAAGAGAGTGAAGSRVRGRGGGGREDRHGGQCRDCRGDCRGAGPSSPALRGIRPRDGSQHPQAPDE